VPGAGAVCAPRLLVACGDQRHRSTAADERQQSAGLAPVTARRGNNPWVHWRRQGPTFLRQTFVAWAAPSTPHSCWALTYAQQQRDKGASHQAAVRALAFNGIRMLFRGWQHRPPDDASVSLHALHPRGSPLLPNLARGS
jgi:Transposase IS116/IS110/IS902 family